MSLLAVEALNTLNEKGLRYKAEVNEGNMAFLFGMLLGGERHKVLITPFEESIQVTGLGDEKNFDTEGFEAFVDQVLTVKAKQEELAKLEEELKS